MQPATYNKLEIHRGSDFLFQFRLKEGGNPVVSDDVQFVLSDGPGGEEITTLSMSDSPATMTVDDTGLYSVRILKSETSQIETSKAFFNVNVVNGENTDLWLSGAIAVYAAAVSDE